MDMKIELIPLPSKDLAESKRFYTEVMGFNLDHDIEPGNGMHVIQLTPPGSACSIVIGTGMGTEDSAPVKGIHLVVSDIEAARNMLAGNGLEISEVNDMGGIKYAFFSDPSDNTWELQQVYAGN
jgi:catechol 2,3-dioxygenase-like lactoylglutathione lyase family enzyme